MTDTLTIPPHRALTMRIASMFYRHRMNTNEIAKILSMPESEIWNRMNLAHEIWRQQVIEDFDAARGMA